ncbi:type IV pilin-like G/H family protein [Leptothermofonsia sp. ETS-13]|uniref:type IV pilin-like G/H family protein n=1 Tax=Leptothermofonsia sp. ETS-13 TaxID=3035696 RepID=UPI003BA3C7F0
MTQPNLLEVAKQGDPEAIAKLMNLALQPKGITAETQLSNGCLEVILTSSRPLNPKALVNFVQRGLANLGTQSIQLVKVYGQKVGDDSPIWVDEFQVFASENRVRSRPSDTQKVTITGPSGNRSNNFLRCKPLRPNARFRGLKFASKRLLFQVRFHLDRWLATAEQATAKVQLPTHLLPAKVRSSKFLTALAIATLPAFLLGAIAAVIASFAQNGSTQTGVPPSSNQTGSPTESSQTQLNEMAEVRKYLDKMNKVQRNFYLKNGRFASSLEELERSASVLSQSHHYTYKLSISSGTQSRLTATPKVDGLKSFTGLVVITKENGTSVATTTVCESKQPAKTAPLIEPSRGNPIQCPADSTRIS